MPAFNPIELEDRQWMLPYLQEGSDGSADFTFANIFLWRRAYRPYVSEYGGRLLIRHDSPEGILYSYPVGSGDLTRAVDLLLEDSRMLGCPFVMCCLTEKYRAILDEAFPGRFEFREIRDDFDYVYSALSLSELSGKKLHAKRNYINRFTETENWSYEPLSEVNLDDCRALFAEWTVRHGGDEPEGLEFEVPALEDAFTYFSQLRFEGGLLRVSGRPVAFTIGEVLSSDTYVVHFEKAFSDIAGAYQMINREFVRQVIREHPEIKHINREDDMGSENLRKSKLSYHPEYMIKKYYAEEKK